jgi:hypothetical protein
MMPSPPLEHQRTMNHHHAMNQLRGPSHREQLPECQLCDLAIGRCETVANVYRNNFVLLWTMCRDAHQANEKLCLKKNRSVNN